MSEQERSQLGPNAEHALAHVEIAGSLLAGGILPAEMAALQKIEQVTDDPFVSSILGMVVGYLASKGLTPEEIGDAATAAARMTQQ